MMLKGHAELIEVLVALSENEKVLLAVPATPVGVVEWVPFNDQLRPVVQAAESGLERNPRCCTIWAAIWQVRLAKSSPKE